MIFNNIFGENPHSSTHNETPNSPLHVLSNRIQLTVASGTGLRKAKYFDAPCPFAVITVDGQQTKTTNAAEYTVNPVWNETFELEVSPLSVITVQVFDQKKFVEAKDQGFLGLVKVSLQKNIDLNNEFEETTLELALNDSFSQTVAQGSIKLSVVVLPGKLPANSSKSESAELSATNEAGAESSIKQKPDPSFRLLPNTDPGDGPLPAGWEERVNEEGKVYYVDHNNKVTTWVDPRRKQLISLRTDSQENTHISRSMSLSQLGPLPAGWEMRLNENGKIFFIDHKKKIVTWDDPRLRVDDSLPQYKRDFKQKQIFFRSLSLLKPEQGKTVLHISRSNVMGNAFTLIMRKSPLSLRRKLIIKFSGEDGLDYGGLSREFFYLLSHKLFDPNYGLFEYATQSNYLLQICPHSHVNQEHLQYFKFVGRILGLAVFHNRFLDAFFTPCFYKVLLKKKLSLKDMQNVDETTYNSLLWVLENPIDDQLELFFTVDDDNFGVITASELLPNGKNIRVNDENKAQYVDLYCKWKLHLRVKDQFEAIKIGFYEVVPYDFIVIFDEKELELLLGGLKEIDVADWKLNTDYKKYKPTDKPITWFWKCVDAFDDEKRMRLLQFVTGTSRLPIQGFKELHGSDGLRRFTIEKTGKTDALPKSHTCFNRLDLPPYPSYDILVAKLTYAIEETVGFATE